jgi:hypothetical protein
MRKRSQFPTPIQDIALNIVFAVMDEERGNRTIDEYMAIRAKLPPLKVLTGKVNQLLKQRHDYAARNGLQLPQICRFKAGDKRIKYEPYPKAISSETVRAALQVSGMREPRWSKDNSL